jgi:hypothetical protein
MNFHNIKTIIALFGLCISLSISTQANACDKAADEAPAKQSKTYRNVNVGFSFSMPSNYRVMVDKDGVDVVNPSTYKYSECLKKNKIGIDGDGSLTGFSVSFTPIRSSKPSLRDLVLQSRPWIEKDSFTFRSVDFLGKKSIVFSQLSQLDDIKNKSTALLSRDRRHLIIISGPEKSQELRKALATFKLN